MYDNPMRPRASNADINKSRERESGSFSSLFADYNWNRKVHACCSLYLSFFFLTILFSLEAFATPDEHSFRREGERKLYCTNKRIYRFTFDTVDLTATCKSWRSRLLRFVPLPRVVGKKSFVIFLFVEKIILQFIQNRKRAVLRNVFLSLARIIYCWFPL